MQTRQNTLKFPGMFLGMLVLVLGLNGCGNSNDAAKARHDPVAIEAGEECHLCGMVISKFAGPKGELYDGNGQVQKFCSTRDLFSWYLQPENQLSSQEIFVHDMVDTPWDKPDDKHLVPARAAWFVINSDMKGAMGATLASFRKQADAQNFIGKHGGTLLQFKDISLEMMTAMNRQLNGEMPTMDQAMPMHSMPGMVPGTQMNSMPGMHHGSPMGGMSVENKVKR